MSHVAAEELVGPLSGDDDAYFLARLLCKLPHAEKSEGAYRKIEMVQYVWDVVEKIFLQSRLRIVEVKFVVVLVKSIDEGRIDTARVIQSYRHIAPDTQLYGIFQERLKLLLRSLQIGPSRLEFPIFDDFLRVLPDIVNLVVGWWELHYVLPQRRGEAVLECLIKFVLSLSQMQDFRKCLCLRRKGKRFALMVVIERLFSCDVASKEEFFLLRVVEGKGVHA